MILLIFIVFFALNIRDNTMFKFAICFAIVLLLFCYSFAPVLRQ